MIAYFSRKQNVQIRKNAKNNSWDVRHSNGRFFDLRTNRHDSRSKLQAAELHDLVSLLFSLVFGISIFVAGVLLVQNPKIKGKRLWPN